jgi:hypothetical protein
MIKAKSKIMDHTHHQKNPHHITLDKGEHQTFLANIGNYKPLIVILIFCILIPFPQIRPLELQEFMYSFMGYFFIFLSLFKFFDLKGFVDGFVTYDIVTKHIRAYGYIYPFIELLLGLGYLTKYDLLTVNLITLIVMVISGIGVIKSILSGQKIKCACFGTVLNVPLSTISILENLGMGIMAAYKLFNHF